MKTTIIRIRSWAREMTASKVADQVAVTKKEAAVASRWTTAPCRWSRVDALVARGRVAVQSFPCMQPIEVSPASCTIGGRGQFNSLLTSAWKGASSCDITSIGRLIHGVDLGREFNGQ